MSERRFRPESKQEQLEQLEQCLLWLSPALELLANHLGHSMTHVFDQRASSKPFSAAAKKASQCLSSFHFISFRASFCSAGAMPNKKHSWAERPGNYTSGKLCGLTHNVLNYQQSIAKHSKAKQSIAKLPFASRFRWCLGRLGWMQRVQPAFSKDSRKATADSWESFCRPVHLRFNSR